MLGQASRDAVADDLRADLAVAVGDEQRAAARARAHRELSQWSAYKRRLISQVVIGPIGADLSRGLLVDSNVGEALLSHAQCWSGEVSLKTSGK